jgi:hypothetical protein
MAEAQDRAVGCLAVPRNQSDRTRLGGYTAEVEREIRIDNPDFTPLITAEVIMAIIGGTTVQIGVFVIAIANHLFPRGDGDR